MDVPKAFISYSHDTLDHKRWVLDLAVRLRNSGIDAILDQWDLAPGDDIPTYMERNLSACDFTLMICTKKYVEKANAGIGGVGYEKMIVTSQLMKTIDQRKIIPIIRQTGDYVVPTFLQSKLFVDFSITEDYEFNFDNLLRALHKAPILNKPQLGSSPFTERIDNESNLLPNHVLRVLTSIIERHDKAEPNHQDNVAFYSVMSKIYAEVAISYLVKEGYISKTGSYLFLTDKGRFYAIENNLTKMEK